MKVNAFSYYQTQTQLPDFEVGKNDLSAVEYTSPHPPPKREKIQKGCFPPLEGVGGGKTLYVKLNSFSYHYTYYYPWLKQQEDTIAEFAINANSNLQLTNKTLSIHYKNKYGEQFTKSLPLNKVNSIEMQFKRLLFPLIIGGIFAPLAFFAAFLGTVHFWIGITIGLLGLSLIYYGWLGSYQLKINAFHAQQFNYFVDFKTKNLDYFIEQTQRLLLMREEIQS